MKNNRHLLFRLASLFIVLSTSCSNNISSVSSTQQDSFHVVSFDSNGGSPVEQQMVRHGEKIIKPNISIIIIPIILKRKDLLKILFGSLTFEILSQQLVKEDNKIGIKNTKKSLKKI